MASLAGKGARMLVERHAKTYEPMDPFYEYYTTADGKEKRRQRPPPPGLTKQEAKLLKKVARRAHYLDKGIKVCGFRFGYTFILGLIPFLGDAANAALNYYLVLKPSKKGADLPEWVVRRMMLNNAVSAGVGLVPLVGDIALAVWKANSRNAKLLEEFLRLRGEEHLAEGLSGLTPEAPALPNGAKSNDRVEPGKSQSQAHPAQAAAKQHVMSAKGQGAATGTTTATNV